MATDVKKHTTIAAGEQPSRAGIAAMILSINDVIPVANETERTQLVANLTSASIAPSTTRPLVVHRADAAGLHRIEYTTDGTTWIPSTGALRFANKAAADAWATSNAALLSADDKCFAIDTGITYRWNGTAWAAWDSGWLTGTGGLVAGSGVINAGSSDHVYKYMSGVIIDTVTVTITNAGTGGGGLDVALPFSFSGTWMGSGRSEIDGSALIVRVQGGVARVFKYNNTTPIAVGTLLFTFQCRPA